jgi:hypothetical protein
MSFQHCHLLSLEQQGDALCANLSLPAVKRLCLSLPAVKRLCASAQEEVQRHGGLTTRVFVHAVVPLLRHSQKPGSSHTQSAALTGLFALRRHGVAPIEKSGESARTVVLDSAAASCPTDLLCMTFTYLSVLDFLAAQRVCRSWRALRLQSSSWPAGGNPTIYAQIFSDNEPVAVQLYALRSLHDELLSTHTSYAFRSHQVKQLVHFLQSPNAELQLASVRVLARFTGNYTPQFAQLIECGGPAILVTLLHPRNSTTMRCAAIYALRALAAHDSTCRYTVISAHAVPSLLELCAQESAQANIALLRAVSCLLCTLCQGGKTLNFQLIQATLPVLARLLCMADEEIVVSACATLAALANDKTEDGRQIAAILALNTLTQPIMEHFSHKNAVVVVSAARTVAHLADGDNTCKQMILDSGILPRTLTLLTHADKGVRVEASRILSALSAGVKTHDEALFAAGVVPELVRILRAEDSVPMRIHAVRIIGNLSACASDAETAYIEQQGVIPLLYSLLRSRNLVLVKFALRALVNVPGDPSERLALLTASGTIPHIIMLLQHHTLEIQELALLVVFKITNVHDTSQLFIAAGILPCLLALITGLKNAYNSLRKSACMVLSNIAANGEQEVAAIIAAGIIPPLMYIWQTNQTDVDTQAALAICNVVAFGSDEQIISLVEKHGVISCLCELLDNQDEEVLTMALNGLEAILHVGGKPREKNLCTAIAQHDGVKRIHALQHCANPDVYEIARSILTTYFGAYEADMEEYS